MFGYIRPFKPYMRYSEYQVYGGFYCGLCKNLGENYGQLYRMMLSYDFAFLGILSNSYNTDPLYFEPQRCIVHPLKKRLCLKNTEALDFTAAAAVISVYQKLCDSISDCSFIKSIPYRIIRKLSVKGYNKAAMKYPETAEKIQIEMNRQLQLESESCKSIDQACEPTAVIMSELAAQISSDSTQSEQLKGFGYHLGRFVYLADAYDDAEDDLKHNNYNVLLKYHSRVTDAKKLADENINMSLCMIAEYYSKMKIQRFKDIIDNVIYLGLKSFSLPTKRRIRKQENSEIVL